MFELYNYWRSHCYVGPKRTEASTSTGTEGQEEPASNSDGSADSSDEDYDDASDDEDDETTTTTSGTQESTDPSSRDDDVATDNQKEQALKSHHSNVDNLSKDEPTDQLTEHVDTLSHHRDEPLPPPSNNSDQLVEYIENPDLENEQSLLSAVDNNPTTTTAASVVENKILTVVDDLETEQSLLSVVDNNVVSPVTDVDNKSFTDETHKSTSSIDDKVDKVIEEILATELLVEHKGDELPANVMYAVEKSESKYLENEGFMYLEDNKIATETVESPKSVLSDFIEDHYSKEVLYACIVIVIIICLLLITVTLIMYKTLNLCISKH